MAETRKVLVCGSISYDTIMRTEDRFRDHILPSNLDDLNLAFPVQKLRREFGGCATNICYSLNQLGCDARPVATVGDDFERYRSRLDTLGIESGQVKVIGGYATPQDFITTDRDDRQIAAFHPGAMDFAHENPIVDLENTTMGVLSPDGLEGMRLHARQFAQAGVPFLFDPGQVTPLLSGEDLLRFIEDARWAIFNSYEWLVFQEKTGCSHEDLGSSLDAHIVTAGAQGSTIYLREETLKIAAACVKQHVDPTGCGDAYRAGVTYGLLEGLDWRAIGQVSSTIGAICYETQGSQNHVFEASPLYSRYSDNYGESAAVRRALLGGG